MEEEENTTLPLDTLLPEKEPTAQAGPRPISLSGSTGEPIVQEEVLLEEPARPRPISLSDGQPAMQEEAPTERTGPRPISLSGSAEEPVARPVQAEPTPEPPILSSAEDPLNFSQKTIEVFQGLQQAVEDIGRPLIEQDFFEDERLQAAVRHQMLTRRDATTALSRAGTFLAGGATFGGSMDIATMPFEDLFPVWQNYQRAFDAGQSVTVGNDIMFAQNATQEELAIIGSGYSLFQSMDNALFGAGTWRETADAVGDYARSILWDPATILTIGVGRALSAGATKLTTAAVRTNLMQAYTNALASGATGRVALAAAGTVARAAPYMAPDLALNVGTDIAQQMQLIKTGAQEDYSGSQTAIAAAATMAIPALIGVSQGAAALRQNLGQDTILGRYFGTVEMDYVTRTMDQDEAWSTVTGMVKKDQLIDYVDENFGRLQGDPSRFLDWVGAKQVAGEIVSESGDRIDDGRLLNMFEQYFWGVRPGQTTASLPEEGVGFFQTLNNAGFIVHPSMLEDNTISGVYGQAISLLSDEAAERVVREFESLTGRKLGITPTADGLAAHFINRSSEAGQTLALRATLSRLERLGFSGQQAMEMTAGVNQQISPTVGDHTRYLSSVYKRLLTSHLATTGANIRGFAQLVSLDSISDIATSAIYMTQSGFYKNFAGDADRAARYMNMARGSIYGNTQRVANIFTPGETMEQSLAILEMNPEAYERMFRNLLGDSGPNEALSQFNMQGNKFFEGVDTVVRGAQALNLVRSQDEITKLWAFSPNFAREIMREFGYTLPEFYRRSDAPLLQQTDRFNFALERAIFRTQRQTASVTWSSLPAAEGMRSAARTFEQVVNREAGGITSFFIPFSSFMNTTIATFGDLTGVNALARAVGHVQGRQLDFADQDFGELMGKAAAGWTIAFYGVPEALERIENGFSWNQDPDPRTLDVEDRTFDWPGSVSRLSSQIIAHALVGENVSSDPQTLTRQIMDGEVVFDRTQVPTELLVELAAQAGPGQAIRDFEGSIRVLQQSLLATMSGEAEFTDFGGEILGSFASRLAQGFTRPLDTPNTLAGLLRDGNMNPDLRQGPELVNQAMRYVNQLLPEVSGVDDLPRRATPLRGTEPFTDLGRGMLGNRQLPNNNLAQRMFNAAGIPNWSAIRWNGPAEVKNTMDSLAAPLFDREALRAFEQNPDYFEGSTTRVQRERILADVRSRVRSQVMDLMETQAVPRSLDAVRRLAGQDQRKVSIIMEHLGYEGDLSDLLTRDDAFVAATRVLDFVERYDDLYFGDLGLDR